MFVGVDGCVGGWVGVAVSRDRFLEARRFENFGALMDAFGGARCIGVDMPIGLVAKGDRDADQAARDFLTGQTSSVFNAPPRPVLAAKDYDAAPRISRRINGKGLSKQSFHLQAKIIEVDGRAGDKRIHEVHPEVSFRLLNGGHEIRFRKKTWGGVRLRLGLLEEAGIVLPEDLGDVNSVGIDDVVDAAVAAWSARRIEGGQAKTFPATTTQRDQSGRSILIWA